MTALRAMFFGLMGAKDKEKEEWDKFSPKKQFQSVTLDNGETVIKSIDNQRLLSND
jgi:hypothetical protein